jgi:hypothetical protein
VGCQLWVLLRVECSGKSVYLYSLRLMSVIGCGSRCLQSSEGSCMSSITLHPTSVIQHLAPSIDYGLSVVGCGSSALLRVECSGKSVYLYSLRLMSVVGCGLSVVGSTSC